MSSLLEEITSEIDEEEYNKYVENIYKLQNKINDTITRHNYPEVYFKIIKYIYVDLSWSIEIFKNLITYKVVDEIYCNELIKLIK